MGDHGLLGASEEWVGLADGEQEHRSPDTWNSTKKEKKTL